MSQQNDALARIRQILENKSAAKQITYRNLLMAFDKLAAESKRIINNLQTEANDRAADVTVDFIEVNEHEFQVKLAGDLLIFVLHTNIVTFDETHAVMAHPY